MLSEYFTISNCVFNLSFLSLVGLFYEILGVPNLHQGALRPLGCPQRKNFTPKTSTLAYLIAFLISTFQLQQFPRYQGVPNSHQGTLRPLGAHSGKILTYAQVFADICIIVNFQLRSSINAGLTERSLYSKFALKGPPILGFWGFCGQGLRYLVETSQECNDR